MNGVGHSQDNDDGAMNHLVSTFQISNLFNNNDKKVLKELAPMTKVDTVC